MELAAVLISLSNVEEMNEAGIKLLVGALESMHRSLEVDIGIIDYPIDWFNDLKGFTKNSNTALYRNYEVAHLMLNQKKHHRFEKAVIYDENEMFKELLSGELKSKGYKVEVANTREEYEKLAKKGAFGTIFVSDTHLDLLRNFIPVKITNGSVVYQMQSIVDRKFINHFNFQAHQSRVNDGFKIFIFDAKEAKKINPKVFEFLISLSLQSVKFGAKIFVSSLDSKLIPPPIQGKMEKSGTIFVDSIDDIFRDSKYTPLLKNTTQSKGLTKKLVSCLPLFIDASLETFESFLEAKVEKRSHKISKYSINFDEKLVSSSLKFEGEVNGTLVLIFSEKIAKKAAYSLLGDDDVSFEELLDAVSEFVNIVGGRAKAIMAEKDTHISIKIPKTFKDEKELIEFLGDKSGVQIDLNINNDPIVMFLTY